MSIPREAFAAWMDKYGQAWEDRDAKAGSDLYAESGTYQVTPFVEPMQGRLGHPRLLDACRANREASDPVRKRLIQIASYALGGRVPQEVL